MRSTRYCSGTYSCSLIQATREAKASDSHAHWDHSRPIRDEFPNATAFFGPGTKEGCSPGHIADPDLQWDGRFFDPVRATEKWAEFSGPWEPFGPFELAHNYFGDGSFWIIQAPGHMPGNLCAAARIEGGHWVLLGSDCSHSRYSAH
jgi:glyoxylase-like metal-dependent hydrolase (beta-lactamase superfamily II)